MSRRTGRNAIRAPQEDEDRDRNAQLAPRPTVVYQHYYTGPVNHIGQANNANFGLNLAHVTGSIAWSPHPGSPPFDLFSALNPILDASHTRNLSISPPNSKCFAGTRQRVIGIVLSWAYKDLCHEVPHILWLYGYAGCGKSAISQAVAEQLAQEGRLAASFFFFRGAGDRSRISRFVTTVAHQLAITFPEAAAAIETAVRANPGLLSSSTSSLSVQFEHLVLQPIAAAATSLRQRPLIFVFDGVDECEDKAEVAGFIEYMINVFAKYPRIPVRFLIASRVENHIRRELHSSSQVWLLNLVDQTSDADIEAAVDASIAKEKAGYLLARYGGWPSPSDKQRLVQHIGRSFIFMTTIIKALFDPAVDDGLTPMDRLPILLNSGPDFDGLYMSLLKPLQHLSHFQDIINTIALAQEALSITQIAELLRIRTVDVVNVLVRLHVILQVPGDDLSPITLWHTSFRDFLCSEDRARPFYAPLAYHRLLAYNTINIAAFCETSPTHTYAKNFAIDHLAKFMDTLDDSANPLTGEGSAIFPLLEGAIFKENQCGLEVACRAQQWKLVHALVNAGANINARFQGDKDDIRVALHAGCHYGSTDMVYFLLDKGADPNIVGQYLLFFRIYPSQCPESQPHSTPIQLL
ncbi:hypothetical protein FA13DRAFT_1473915 [Coprinellus micaceus]|uniref:NACHT domain-containing protein n=1 Tax=Coprinellus micaceus TaxID=71717 RepID=A0A4Y7SL87_COPMI|nr:hypothetical protein FA13DRAFT_1473915 [Coprinellus micaceus]